jgi:hypothetical protein
MKEIGRRIIEEGLRPAEAAPDPGSDAEPKPEGSSSNPAG